MEGVRFLFVPDWSHLTGSTFLVALGQAFFSLSVGVTAMMTYASYLPKEEKLGQSAVNVVILNITISILAGLVIFPAVFALGHSPAEGPGLIFVILPAIFSQIPFGNLFMIIFFILMLFATLTSSIAMLEIVVSTGIREKHNRRRRAAWVFGILIFVVGIPSALSFGVLSDVKIFGGTIFDFADTLTSKIANATWCITRFDICRLCIDEIANRRRASHASCDEQPLEISRQICSTYCYHRYFHRMDYRT